MTIDTPAGTINQITPIREFVELTTITNAQYLLGIQNMSTGNGSKITFGNLITSLISGDAGNKLVKGSDDKLFISTPIEIGTLANLTTSDKTDLVSAINELNSNMGSLSNLETTVKTSLVAAINSVAELTEPELLIDKVNQSKALVTGNVAGYQEELEQLKIMKRSTFDMSKFTKQGNPIITSAGVASGFSNTNYLTFPAIQLGNYNSWEVVTPIFNLSSAISGNLNSVLIMSYNIFYGGVRVDITDALKLRVLIASSDSTDNDIINLSSLTLSANTNYQVKISFTGTEYIVWYKANNGEWQEYDRVSSTTKIYNALNMFQIGQRNYITTYFNGSIDLKGFSIIADGVEVFNGNKQGIDTIKPNDFAEGSNGAVISDDGILSVSGDNKGIRIPVDFRSVNELYIEHEFTLPKERLTGLENLGYAFLIPGSPIPFYMWIGYWGFSYGIGTTGTGNMRSQQLRAGATYKSYLHYKNGTYTAGVKRIDIADNWTISDEKSGTLENFVGTLQYGNDYQLAGTGKVFTFNLNALKIYVDGDLVYQPCLKIPYFETSVQYGSKIVDATYRDRVLDAYEQGFKDYKYYTLDEVNSNFTLPHGEIYGMLEQIRTENEQNNEAVRQIVDVKDNLYKILEGHQSTNKTLWDLITFTDNSEADNLLIGGDSPFTSNSSNSNFHFYLLNSIIGTNQPDDTAKLNVYKLFNKSHYDAQNDPIYVADGTIVIACANPTKLSKILLRSYDTYYTTPSIIHIHGANITNNMSRDITMTDFTSYAKYIGGISTTKEDTYTTPTNTNWGINRPIELTIDDKDTFNTFFISMSHWCSGQSGWNRRLVGVQVYGTQMTNDDSNYTVKMSGDYENCKWIASNGKIYNTDDLYQQYGYIPKEKVELSRWISCFGSGIGQANATTRAADQYYPKYISGTISTTKNNGGQPWYFLRQTNYSAEPRPQVGYNISGQGYLDINSTLNNQTVIDYTADSSFPIGEYYWEGTFGYNQSPTAHNGDTYMCGWCQLQKVYDDDSVEIIQTFSKEGSMYEPSVCYRTPRFYANRAFKKLRLIIKEMAFPNAAMILSQMQLYYRDTAGNIARSFIPNATQYDLSYNTVKHKSNIHFFITPTGVRVGSNCFIEKTDPTTKAACVGNRWINENTKKSYVCNTSGIWTEEDFCEIGCMTMFGSKHKGMRLRTVANSENPMQKYIQDHGDMGGNLALDYPLAVNASTVVTSSPTDPDFYFQAESKDENEGVEFSLPANTKTLQSYRRSLVKSKVYQGGQQFAHWSNCDHTGAILKAYKTFDTSAAGEYIEGSEEEEQ